jgi:hypothetical protein
MEAQRSQNPDPFKPERVGHPEKLNQSPGVDVPERYHPNRMRRQEEKLRKGGPPAGGSLVEAWLGGEGPFAGAGKITSPSDTSILQGFLGFIGVGISAGPFAGFQVGAAGSSGWGGLFLEGHLGTWAVGTGAYVSTSCHK